MVFSFHSCDSVMISDWPEYREELVFEEDSINFEKIIDAIKEIRNVRAQMKVPSSRKAKVIVQSQTPEIFKQAEPFFIRLASADGVSILSEGELPPEKTAQIATDSARIFLPLEDLIDFDKERARLLKEKEECEKEIVSYEAKLSNESFVNKAPKAVVAAQQDRLERAKQRLEKIVENLNGLK